VNKKLILLFIILLLFFLGLVFGLRYWKQNQSLSSQDVALPVAEEETSASQTGYIDVSPEEANELIEKDPDLIIVDVSPDYDQGHLPGAVNYYLGDGSLDEALPTLDKSKTYLVYCHIDSVAISGAQKFVEAGFPKVYRLEGNYAAWVEAGYPIETPVDSLE